VKKSKKKQAEKIKHLEATNEVLGAIIKAYGKTYVKQSEIIETFAEAIVERCSFEGPFYHDVHCIFCDNVVMKKEVSTDDDFVHAKNCPVPLAKKILKRFENEV